jgi:hypothetical protein
MPWRCRSSAADPPPQPRDPLRRRTQGGKGLLALVRLRAAATARPGRPSAAAAGPGRLAHILRRVAAPARPAAPPASSPARRVRLAPATRPGGCAARAVRPPQPPHKVQPQRPSPGRGRARGGGRGASEGLRGDVQRARQRSRCREQPGREPCALPPIQKLPPHTHPTPQPTWRRPSGACARSGARGSATAARPGGWGLAVWWLGGKAVGVRRGTSARACVQCPCAGNAAWLAAAGPTPAPVSRPLPSSPAWRRR